MLGVRSTSTAIICFRTATTRPGVARTDTTPDDAGGDDHQDPNNIPHVRPGRDIRLDSRRRLCPSCNRSSTLAAATGTTPFVKPIVDLISPVLRVLIDLGYDRTLNPGIPRSQPDSDHQPDHTHCRPCQRDRRRHSGCVEGHHRHRARAAGSVRAEWSVDPGGGQRCEARSDHGDRRGEARVAVAAQDQVRVMGSVR